MIISNLELAELVGELTGSKTTSILYYAALAAVRDDSESWSVDALAEIVSHATRYKKGKRLALYEKELCKRIYQISYGKSIYPLPTFHHDDDTVKRWNKEWG